MSDLEKKIIKQVEYYFSDRNYPRDKFMQQTAKKDDGHWIPLSTLMTFNKLKALSSDESVVAEALKDAPSAMHFEINESGDAVRRDPTKPIAAQAELDDRTIYVKGFDPETISIDSVAAFFKEQGYEPEHIQIRRHFKTKEPKPSAFVQFPTKELAQQVLEKPLALNGKDLEVHMKKEYLDMKAALRREQRQEKKKDNEKARQEKVKETVSAIMDKDCVIHFANVTPDTSREDLKDVFEEFGEIAWVDFARGETEGYIRFKTQGAAPAAIAALKERGTEINGNKPELRLLQGEEEKEYWVKMENARAAVRKEKRANRASNKRKKGGRQYSSKRAKEA